MLIATFGPSTGWYGKTITYQDDVFVLEDHGPISAGDIMHYDGQGHLEWPNEGMRAWVGSRAQGAFSAPPSVAAADTPAPPPAIEVVEQPSETPVQGAADSGPDQACSACGGPLLPEFRFCPFCGREANTAGIVPAASIDAALPKNGDETPRAHSTVIVGEGSPPGPGITIEFPVSTAQSFEFALAAAQELPGFQQVGEGKKVLYRVTFDPREVEQILGLVEQLKGWRRRSVYVDGEKVPWDAVFDFVPCFERRRGSYRPDYYCFGYENEWEFNLWGCLQARMPFTERAEWFTWGQWLNKKGDWEFDKARIRHELEKTLYRVRFCPAMQSSPADAVLGAIPDQVNPNKNSNWKFVQSWDDSAPGLKMVTTEYGFKQTVVMKGVAPNGQGAIDEIGKRLRAKGHHLPAGR